MHLGMHDPSGEAGFVLVCSWPRGLKQKDHVRICKKQKRRLPSETPKWKQYRRSTTCCIIEGRRVWKVYLPSTTLYREDHHLSLGTWCSSNFSSISLSCFPSRTFCNVITASFVLLRMLLSSSISRRWRSVCEDVRLTPRANWAAAIQREEANHLLWPSCRLISSLRDRLSPSPNTKLCRCMKAVSVDSKDN